MQNVNTVRVSTILGLTLMLTGLAGCLSPIVMHRAVIEYDRTVSYVEADLLLINIARARYHRPVHFTAVSSVAENSTITIVPVTGEEFTKRVLRPLDEDKFEFLLLQGYSLSTSSREPANVSG